MYNYDRRVASTVKFQDGGFRWKVLFGRGATHVYRNDTKVGRIPGQDLTTLSQGDLKKVLRDKGFYESSSLSAPSSPAEEFVGFRFRDKGFDWEVKQGPRRWEVKRDGKYIGRFKGSPQMGERNLKARMWKLGFHLFEQDARKIEKATQDFLKTKGLSSSFGVYVNPGDDDLPHWNLTLEGESISPYDFQVFGPKDTVETLRKSGLF